MLDTRLYPYKSNFLNIDKYNYHYVDEGEGEVMLMVHGNPTWSFYYRNLINEFSKTHRVVVPDHIGCGLSSKPQNYEYTLKNHIENLKLLVKFLEIKNITLVVHDWGGAIGFGLATQMPELIKRVVVLNTAAFHIDRIPFRINLCKIPYIGPFIVRAFNAFAFPATFMTTVLPLKENVKSGYLHPYNNYHNRKAIAEFVKDIPMTEEHRSYGTLKEVEAGLEKLNIPMLILWGGKDFCFNDESFVKWRELFPEAEYRYYKDAGHYVIEDKLDECIHEIRGFIS